MLSLYTLLTEVPQVLTENIYCMKKGELIRFYKTLDNNGFIAEKHRNGNSLMEALKIYEYSQASDETKIINENEQSSKVCLICGTKIWIGVHDEKYCKACKC